MTRIRLRELALVLALAIVVWYFRRRERTITASLTRSEEWTARGSAATATPTDADAEGGVDHAALSRAAGILGASPDAVPERVEALDRKVRELTTDVEKTRAAWAKRWWDARRRTPLPADEPHVTLLTIDDGVLADAEAIAQAALDAPQGVTIVVVPDDGTLAVAVGADVEDERADDLAQEIASAAGGGAGGSAEFATGGGDGERLLVAAEDVRDRLAGEGFAT